VDKVANGGNDIYTTVHLLFIVFILRAVLIWIMAYHRRPELFRKESEAPLQLKNWSCSDAALHRSAS
jgi:hypothetical protein